MGKHGDRDQITQEPEGNTNEYSKTRKYNTENASFIISNALYSPP